MDLQQVCEVMYRPIDCMGALYTPSGEYANYQNMQDSDIIWFVRFHDHSIASIFSKNQHNHWSEEYVASERHRLEVAVQEGHLRYLDTFSRKDYLKAEREGRVQEITQSHYLLTHPRMTSDELAALDWEDAHEWDMKVTEGLEAQRLLKNALPEEMYQQYKKTGQIDIQSKLFPQVTYCVKYGCRTHVMWKEGELNVIIATLCAVTASTSFVTSFEVAAHVLSLYLEIVTNEKKFIHTGIPDRNPWLRRDSNDEEQIIQWWRPSETNTEGFQNQLQNQNQYINIQNFPQGVQVLQGAYNFIVNGEPGRPGGYGTGQGGGANQAS